ncbi:unnamed protein product [Paramecium sonneborni]|uniref:Uncharacterized protein n=1 Tax=Paramecium sonneborni TaxID=65129 RepID=A0A8S1KJY2_9CILI|nr:unnamed protein product [Paramecium sonneborni]
MLKIISILIGKYLNIILFNLFKWISYFKLNKNLNLKFWIMIMKVLIQMINCYYQCILPNIGQLFYRLFLEKLWDLEFRFTTGQLKLKNKLSKTLLMNGDKLKNYYRFILQVMGRNKNKEC